MGKENPMKSYKHYKGKRSGRVGRKLLTVLLALILAAVLLFGAMFGVVMAGDHDDISGDPQVMVILGCQVMPAGHPSVLLRDRLDEALDYLGEHPDMIVVVSGGQGDNEPATEASAMADYLMANGVPAENILQEDRSHNTWQNLNNTAELLSAEGYDTTADIVVVSNGFHLARVRMLWGRVWGGDYNLSTLAAPSSHVPSRLKMYLREPLALVKSFLFDRG